MFTKKIRNAVTLLSILLLSTSCGSFRITANENKSRDDLNGQELQEKTTSVVQEGNPNGEEENPESPLYTVSRIWTLGAHNAFTDLIEYGGKYFCAFREAESHVPKKPKDDGKIRILVSTDGTMWESAALIAKNGYDLRDPKLSITPNGRLMVLFGGAVYKNGKKLSHTDYVSFLEDHEAKSFSAPQPISLQGLPPGSPWLWRVTWNRNAGYGVVYQSSNIYLVTTTDGINYTLVTGLDVSGEPNESTVELLNNGRMRILVRREGGDMNGWLGYSNPPYTDWTWTDLDIRLGGPHIITLPDGKTIIGSRSYRENRAYTSLFELDNTNKVVKLLELPSGGDTSYPGLIIIGNELWVSYYSSHEGKSSIYFAKIRYRRLFN